jgi:hypothetical protein
MVSPPAWCSTRLPVAQPPLRFMVEGPPAVASLICSAREEAAQPPGRQEPRVDGLQQDRRGSGPSTRLMASTLSAHLAAEDMCSAGDSLPVRQQRNPAIYRFAQDGLAVRRPCFSRLGAGVWSGAAGGSPVAGLLNFVTRVAQSVMPPLLQLLGACFGTGAIGGSAARQATRHRDPHAADAPSS